MDNLWYRGPFSGRILCEIRPAEPVHSRRSWLVEAVEKRRGISPERLQEVVDKAVEIPSRFRRSSIFRIEWITVEWCLPPKLRPISGSDACVSDLHRYIAIWRGIATDFELLRDFSSVELQLVVVGDELLDDLDRDRLVVVVAGCSRSTSCASAARSPGR